MKKIKLITILYLGLAIIFGMPNASKATYSTDTTNTNETEVVSIILSGEGKNIEWEINGYSAKGFKVVWSKNSGPTYPLRNGDKYNYYTNPDKKTDTLIAFNGDGNYYVRVCEYLGGKCGVYSNEIMINLGDRNTNVDESNNTEENIIDKIEEVSIASITLNGNDKNIEWSIDGYSGQGFKVVWSKNSGATYPLRNRDKYHYYSSPNQRTDTLSAFDGNGDYYVRVCEYLGGKCRNYSNEIITTLSEGTYYNKETNNDEQIKEIKENAKLLSDNNLDDILNEIKELRNIINEQHNEIKYLRDLITNMSGVAEEILSTINNFITYGVDDNTKRLGEGERAAVIHSFKSAYGKLPETQEELTDVVKIANGRWPSQVNAEAEQGAMEEFGKIYNKSPDLNNSHDEAAIKIMAYGLRQSAQNRNLESERNGIKIFKWIYNKVPETTEEWNILQAITYSGAKK